jgi:hypothetical protein
LISSRKTLDKLEISLKILSNESRNARGRLSITEFGLERSKHHKLFKSAMRNGKLCLKMLVALRVRGW